MVPDAGAYVAGLVDISPAWYVAPLIVVLIGGSLGGSVSSLYGTGLDFSSVVPRLNRMQATVAIGAVSIVLVFLGRFVFNLVDTVNAFTTLILVLAAPWVSILLVGYLTRRGHYLVEDLQVFNRGQQGGAYWFTRGLQRPHDDRVGGCRCGPGGAFDGQHRTHCGSPSRTSLVVSMSASSCRSWSVALSTTQPCSLSRSRDTSFPKPGGTIRSFRSRVGSGSAHRHRGCRPCPTPRTVIE